MGYFDDQGNPVEGVLSPEEAKELQGKAAKAEEFEKTLEEKEKELGKYKSKEINFENLRTKTEAEKADLMKNWNDKEKALYKEIESMRNEREKEKEGLKNNAKDQILKQLAGDNVELRKRIELQAEEFAGEANTPEEVVDRYTKSATLVNGSRPRVNPIHQLGMGNGGYVEPDFNPKRFTDTDQGKESVKKWFPGFADKVFKDKANN